MACNAIRKWTFGGLVGTFLDLSITFLLLCASALVYFASSFLSFLGLDLPCSCTGFLKNSNYCFQSQLVDSPSQKLVFVQYSVKSKFPFHCNHQKPNKHESEVEAASCLSSSDRMGDLITGDLGKIKERGFVMGAMSLPDLKERRFLRRRSSRNNLRRRRKTSVDNRKLQRVSSFRSSWSDAEMFPLAQDENDNSRDGKEECLLDIGSKRKISQGFELCESVDENDPIEDDKDAKKTIRLLEQALEEEHAARAELYLELEKERSAAATAADEAMAMILRLQDEKASIEMESMQRQRIVEDKYAYDEEEMNILKEILVRREREKYFLEKEVEAYRQLMGNYEQLDADMYGIAPSLAKGELTLYLSDDESVVVMPHNIEDVDLELSNAKLILQDNKSSIESTTPPSYDDDTDRKDEFDDKETEGVLVHDVHVIEDKNKQVVSNSNNSTATNTHIAAKTVTSPIVISSGLPPISRRNSFRRNSMSSFDAERYKIDNEISWLREKLKFVQEGREKLNLKKSNREREKAQLRILDDITSQLKEIRHLTEPGKLGRRASLPPLSSDVTSKKRRPRGGAGMVQGSE